MGTSTGGGASRDSILAAGIVELPWLAVGGFTVSEVSFRSSDVAAVAAEMRTLASASGPRGWINIAPGLRDDQLDRLPQPTLLGRWFSGRGPAVPMATWMPPQHDPATAPQVVGIEHGAGPNALDHLRDAGTPLPHRWRKVQDHARGGIVVEASLDASHEEVLAWMLGACRTLCRLDLDDHWIARVHSR